MGSANVVILTADVNSGTFCRDTPFSRLINSDLVALWFKF